MLNTALMSIWPFGAPSWSSSPFSFPFSLCSGASFSGGMEKNDLVSSSLVGSLNLRSCVEMVAMKDGCQDAQRRAATKCQFAVKFPRSAPWHSGQGSSSYLVYAECNHHRDSGNWSSLCKEGSPTSNWNAPQRNPVLYVHGCNNRYQFKIHNRKESTTTDPRAKRSRQKKANKATIIIKHRRKCNVRNAKS